MRLHGSKRPTLAIVLIAVTAALAAALPQAASPTARRCRAGWFYYVDARHGNDANCGTSPERAWRSVKRVNSFHFRPGHSVYFAGGEHIFWGYRGRRLAHAYLTVRSGVSYGSYGGRPAILDGQSYYDGSGRKHLDGILLCGVHDVTIAGLDLEGGSDAANAAIGIQSSENRRHCRPSRNVTLYGDLIANWFEAVQAGYADSNWTIAGLLIDHTAGNGILFDRRDGVRNRGGDALDVLYSDVLNTGEYPPSTYHVHGIYDNSPNSQVVGNKIVNFSDDGISVRFHGAVVKDNVILGGQEGIGVYEADSVGGISQFIHNTIADTSAAAIFVCGRREGCPQPLDAFVIKANMLGGDTGDGLNLQPTLGGYYLEGNEQVSQASVANALASR